MRIGIHVRALSRPLAGIGLLVRNLVRELQWLDYDLVWKRYPETMSVYNRLVHRCFADVEKSIREPESIIAISQSTKQDLESLLGVPAQKGAVCYFGVSSHFRKECTAEFVRSLRARLVRNANWD
jgi:hypothetical protein